MVVSHNIPPKKHNLVGGLEHISFFHILGIIIPTDYFSEGLKPPTSKNIPIKFPLQLVSHDIP
jgi:hypothetical protein